MFLKIEITDSQILTFKKLLFLMKLLNLHLKNLIFGLCIFQEFSSSQIVEIYLCERKLI